MSYEVLILRRAQKELADLPKTDYERIRDAVGALAENPRCLFIAAFVAPRERSKDSCRASLPLPLACNLSFCCSIRPHY